MKLRIISLIISSVCFFSLLWLSSQILKPKWYFQLPGIEPATKIIDGFYDEPKNSIDVIYLGSSNMYRDVNPLQIYETYGITGYVLGSSVQRMWISEYYLKEALKYQRPKVVVLDMLSIIMDTPNDENRNRKALDYTRFSLDKVKAIRDSIPDDGSESFLSYIFPVLRYHSRWNELTADDFKYFFTDKHYYLKGFDLNFSCIPQTMDFDNTSRDYPNAEKALKSLDSIVDICENNNIQLVLIKTPIVGWTKGSSMYIHEYAIKKGLKFIDYNECYEEAGINTESDFSDVSHLNAYGAEKLSIHLGKVLCENTSLGNYIAKDLSKAKIHRGGGINKQWSEDYARYCEEKAAYELQTDFTRASYVKRWNNPNFIVFMTGKRDTDSYISIVESGNIICENIGAGKLEFNTDVNGLKISLTSTLIQTAENTSIMIDNTEYSKNQAGLNIVIYDKLLGRVIDSCWLADGSETISR